jgi:fructose-bisphosphate aldolase class II
MIDTAKSQSFAFPAVNCVGSEAVNAALKGFADAGSDGIIQFSTGGAEFASGLGVKDMVTGAVALAEFAHVVAQRYPVTVALYTDHFPKDKLTYVRPLLVSPSTRRRRSGPAVQLTRGTARPSRSMRTSTSPWVYCATPQHPM